MELFKGRPMAFIGTAALVCALLGWYLSGWAKLLVAAAVCLLFLLLICLVSCGRICRRNFVTGIIVCLVSVCVLLRAYFYFDCRYLGMTRLCGEEHEFTARMIKRSASGAYSERFEAEIESIDGESTDCRAWISCEYAASYQPGTLIGFCAVPEPFEKTALYDGERAALSQGYMLGITLESEENCAVLSDEALPGLRGAMLRLNAKLSFALSEGVGGDAGALAAAMLLGDRGGIDDSVERDFSRAGVSHLLALSGLHLSVIAGAVGWLLSRLRMPKPLKTLLLAGFVLFYLALTGFLLSTVRAAVMLLMVWGAYYSGADSDGVSSVFLAAVLILIVSPAAIVDAGFMLSFSAAFGIAVFLPVYTKWSSKKLTALRQSAGKVRICAARFFIGAGALLLTGLSANCFTLIIIWSLFGAAPLAAPLTNLLLTPLAGPFLALSMVYLPLDGVPVFGKAVAAAVRLIADIMLRSCAWISDIRGAVISLEYDFTPYILIFAALFMLVMLAVRLRRKLLVFLPPLAAASAFALCLFLGGANTNPVSVECLSNGSSEALILTSAGGAVIVDIGDGSYGSWRSAVGAAEANGATEIEALVLTHYHQRHTASAERLMKREKVRRVWMPYPQNSRDAGIMARISEAASREGVECAVYYPGEAMICFGDAAIVSSGPVTIERSTHPVIRLTVYVGEQGSVEYIGSSAWEAPTCAGGVGSGTVIFGSHGPVIKSASPVVLGDGVDEAVFCSGAAAYAVIEGGAADVGKIRLMVCPQLWRGQG